MYHCFFRRYVCLSNLKHTPLRELPLTARKTVFSHLKVKVYTGNAHITRVLGMGMPKTRGCPYHWDTASFPFPSFLPSYFHVRAFSPRTLLSQSLERDPTNTRPDLLPTNTRHFDFLSPDRSPNNPRWRQSRNQSR